jgi:hypothetical protein
MIEGGEHCVSPPAGAKEVCPIMAATSSQLSTRRDTWRTALSTPQQEQQRQHQGQQRWQRLLPLPQRFKQQEWVWRRFIPIGRKEIGRGEAQRHSISSPHSSCKSCMKSVISMGQALPHTAH